MNNDLIKLEEILKTEKKYLSAYSRYKNDRLESYVREGNSYILRFVGARNEENTTTTIVSDSEEEMRKLVPHLDKRDHFFSAVQSWILPILEETREFSWKEPCRMFYMPDNVEFKAPVNKVEPIRYEDANIVNNNWTYGSDESLPYMQERIREDISGAVYVHDKLVSWCIVHADGSLGSLFTFPEHRRSNYAYDITSYLITKYREQKRVPYIFCVENNDKSIPLAKKMGFEEVCKVSWFGLKVK